MKLLILLAIVAVVYASTDRAVYNEWKAHVAKYNRKYSSAEHAREGFANFAREYQRVLDHNKKFRSGQETFEAGLNQFSDMSDEEKEQLIGLKPPMSVPVESFKRSIDARNLWKSGNGYIYNQIIAEANLPASVDHTKYAGTVRDQKTCGSCYSFTANKVLEMNLRKKFNQSFDLAPQQLVDCGFAVGDNGCNGGVPDVTFDYFMSNAGCFLKESEYPYKGAVQTKTVDQCVALCSTKSIKAKVSGYVRAIANDLNSVKTLLAQGPIFGALYVNTKGAFYSYKSGLLNDPSTGTPNHAITVVGYQKMNGVDAFKILNSWSTSWGEGGFGWIRADQLNILSYAYYPNVTLTA